MAGDNISVIIDRGTLMFMDDSGMMTTIQGLKLNYLGVLKEHPDLKDDEEWRLKAIERLKEHIKKYQTEMDKLNYVKEELIKFGHEALFYQRAGHRPKKW